MSAEWTERLIGCGDNRILTWSFICLMQELANIFCEKPGSKYFQLLGYTVSFATAEICHCRETSAVAKTEVNGRGCVPRKQNEQGADFA